MALPQNEYHVVYPQYFLNIYSCDQCLSRQANTCSTEQPLNTSQLRYDLSTRFIYVAFCRLKKNAAFCKKKNSWDPSCHLSDTCICKYTHIGIFLCFTPTAQRSASENNLSSQESFLILNQLTTFAVKWKSHASEQNFSHKQTLEQLTSLKSHTGHSGYFHIAEKRTVTVQRYLRAKSRRPAAAHSGRGCGEPGAATGEPWQEEARWAEPCGRTPGRSEGRAEPPPAGTERGGAARGRYRRGWGCEALVTALPGAQPRDLPRRCCCRRRRRRGPECGAERGPPTTRPPRWAGPCRRFSARGLPGTVVLEEPRGRREL